jgi:hypothetical protein
VRRARGGFISAGGHGRGQGRAADLTERRGERACGLGVDGNGYKPAGFCYPKPVPVKNIYTH